MYNHHQDYKHFLLDSISQEQLQREPQISYPFALESPSADFILDVKHNGGSAGQVKP